jgi:CTP:molybdopterin cytidylyltransferase MocA
VTIAAVVLAAGDGTRYLGDHPKLLAPFRGAPLVTWAVQAAVDAELDEVIIVAGAVDLSGLSLPGRVVSNDRWADGQATSLQLGIMTAERSGHDAVVVGLGDQPLVGGAAWRAVAASAATPIVVATFNGERRPPVRLSAAVWPLVPTSGDEGARALMRERPDLVSEIPCSGEPVDIDTLEDLARWS